jgi:hypothetical protein
MSEDLRAVESQAEAGEKKRQGKELAAIQPEPEIEPRLGGPSILTVT